MAAEDAIATCPSGLTGMDMLATAPKVVLGHTPGTLKVLIVEFCLFCLPRHGVGLLLSFSSLPWEGPQVSCSHEACLP